MNKIYILAHKHPFDDGHIDEKLIGSFFTKKKALQILDDYKNLEGFRDHLDGFYIQEVEIDGLNEKELTHIIKEKREH
ncbi:MAG: hypothetical protein K1060chlam3_00939 [Candidatus Anoxychlamydiales bacterium]|nr:hypothetical protein [Candidatus Anoxychlamydiales bacterium]